MSQLCSLAELNENLVPFTARRVTSSLIRCAEDVRNTETLRNACSYIIDPTSSASAKVFYAERYGGSGIQHNGGGARCGFDGYHQIKGMGANPLFGEGTDGRHSNGALGAIHAIYRLCVETSWHKYYLMVLCVPGQFCLRMCIPTKHLNAPKGNPDERCWYENRWFARRILNELLISDLSRSMPIS